MYDFKQLEKLIYIENSILPAEDKTDASIFFKKYRNKYLLGIIIDFLPNEEKARFRFLNRLFYALIDTKDFFPKMIIEKKKFRKEMNYINSIDCFFIDFNYNFGDKDSILRIKEFYSAWLYNYYLNNEDEVVTVNMRQEKLSEENKTLLVYSLIRIKKPMELDLNSIGLETELLKDLFHNPKKFIKLNIGMNCSLDNKVCKYLHDSLIFSENLIYLDFSYLDIEYDRLKILSPAIKTRYKLEYLSLDGNQFCMDSFKIIFKEIGKLPKLEIISLRETNLQEDGCILLGNYLGSWNSNGVKYLDISWNPIDNKAIEHIVNGFNKNKGLIELKMNKLKTTLIGFSSLCNSLSNNKSINSIEYKDNVVSLNLINNLNDNILPTTKIKTVDLTTFRVKIDPFTIKNKYITHRIFI